MSNQTNGNQTESGRFAKGNSLGNRFKKGETGNPNGRPRRTMLTDALREQLAEELPNADGRTIAEGIARKLIQEALKGNVRAIQEIGDRTEGKPKQTIDLDLEFTDWREQARQLGLTEADVLTEAKLLIESDSYSGD